MAEPCELCAARNELVLWRDESCRVILVNDDAYPGFCRVIWNAHVREMTDLPVAQREQLMHVVYATESAVRSVCSPLKVNLASFGNVVPHLHWHVIPRYADDRHFPNPIWGGVQREYALPREPANPDRLHEQLKHYLQGD